MVISEKKLHSYHTICFNWDGPSLS